MIKLDRCASALYFWNRSLTLQTPRSEYRYVFILTQSALTEGIPSTLWYQIYWYFLNWFSFCSFQKCVGWHLRIRFVLTRQIVWSCNFESFWRIPMGDQCLRYWAPYLQNRTLFLKRAYFTSICSFWWFYSKKLPTKLLRSK